MSCLLGLSNELIHEILLKVGPADLAHVSQCCRSLYTFISDNELLWKELYLEHFVSAPFLHYAILTNTFGRTILVSSSLM